MAGDDLDNPPAETRGPGRGGTPARDADAAELPLSRISSNGGGGLPGSKAAELTGDFDSTSTDARMFLPRPVTALALARLHERFPEFRAGGFKDAPFAPEDEVRSDGIELPLSVISGGGVADPIDARAMVPRPIVAPALARLHELFRPGRAIRFSELLNRPLCASAPSRCDEGGCDVAIGAVCAAPKPRDDEEAGSRLDGSSFSSEPPPCVHIEGSSRPQHFA